MYENILSAVKSSKLSSAQEIENYDVFSKLQKEGVVLSDLVRKASEADDLRKKLSDERRRVIEEICMHDDRYRQAMEDYRAEVNRTYVDMKESKDVI